MCFVLRAILFIYLLFSMQTGMTGCTLDFRKSQDAQEESKCKPILFADIAAASGATFIIIVTERYS